MCWIKNAANQVLELQVGQLKQYSELLDLIIKVTNDNPENCSSTKKIL